MKKMKKYISQVFNDNAKSIEGNRFSEKLMYETDIADLAFDFYHQLVDYTILDVRSQKDFQECHIPGAISCPGGNLPQDMLEVGAKIVVYCWGPSCNGATKAAMKLMARGDQVKELLGGIEYWAKENCPLEGKNTARALFWDYASLG